jgi:hypothetical protein
MDRLRSDREEDRAPGRSSKKSKKSVERGKSGTIILGVFTHGGNTIRPLELDRNTNLDLNTNLIKFTFAPRGSGCLFSGGHRKELAKTLLELINEYVGNDNNLDSIDDILDMNHELKIPITELECVSTPHSTDENNVCSIALRTKDYPKLLEATVNDRNYDKFFTATREEPFESLKSSLINMFDRIVVLYDSEELYTPMEDVKLLPNEGGGVVITSQILYRKFSEIEKYKNVVIYDFSCDAGSSTNMDHPRGGRKSRKRKHKMKRKRRTYRK